MLRQVEVRVANGKVLHVHPNYSGVCIETNENPTVEAIEADT